MYYCAYCSKYFRLPRVWVMHILVAHKTMNSDTCDICDEKFYSKDDFNNHLGARNRCVKRTFKKNYEVQENKSKKSTVKATSSNPEPPQNQIRMMKRTSVKKNEVGMQGREKVENTVGSGSQRERILMMNAEEEPKSIPSATGKVTKGDRDQDYVRRQRKNLKGGRTYQNNKLC